MELLPNGWQVLLVLKATNEIQEHKVYRVYKVFKGKSERLVLLVRNDCRVYNEKLGRLGRLDLLAQLVHNDHKGYKV